MPQITGIDEQNFTTPVADIKRRIGDDEIGFQVFVGIVQKRAFVVPFHLRTVNAANGEVHFRQSLGGLVAFLPVNGNIVYAALVFFDEFFRLHKQADLRLPGLGLQISPTGFKRHKEHIFGFVF